MCTNSTCVLFSSPSGHKRDAKPLNKQYDGIYEKLKRPNIPSIVWPWDRVANHKPAFDGDSDLFSVMMIELQLLINNRLTNILEVMIGEEQIASKFHPFSYH